MNTQQPKRKKRKSPDFFEGYGGDQVIQCDDKDVLHYPFLFLDNVKQEKGQRSKHALFVSIVIRSDEEIVSWDLGSADTCRTVVLFIRKDEDCDDQGYKRACFRFVIKDKGDLENMVRVIVKPLEVTMGNECVATSKYPPPPGLDD